MKKIIHLVPHLGGGVGTVLRALLSEFPKKQRYKHEIICFEDLNSQSRTWAKQESIKFYDEISPESEWLHREVEKADIVQLHFWNHPATYHFLHAFSGRKARMVFWAHTNGHHAPYLFNREIVEYPEIFTVTSAYSLSVNSIAEREREWINNHIRSIHSSSGTKGTESIIPEKHAGFIIGYIGTVDYCKMHREFISICTALEIPDLRIIVCGGPNEGSLQAEVDELGVSRLFDIRGHVNNIEEVFSELDLLLYPLASKNYGTGEQVLIEAMSAGVPQVVLDNGPESFVVKNNQTGIVAGDISSCVDAVNKLYHNEKLRREMAVNSRDYARAHFNILQTVELWDSLYSELLQREKKQCHFPLKKSEDLPLSLFFSALGDCSEADLFQRIISEKNKHDWEEEIALLDPIFTGETRGSIRHYSKFFENHETTLHYIANIIEHMN